ncbi:MAG: hypothetical protein H6742_09560 [Alphaproteobacteria bacterium]|nr:hypothetical protein [Alphaproteobacteria bacterium]
MSEEKKPNAPSADADKDRVPEQATTDEQRELAVDDVDAASPDDVKGGGIGFFAGNGSGP